MSSVCVLASGGIDSAVLVSWLLRDGSTVEPLYVRTGAAWEPVEERWLRRFLAAVASPHLRPLHVVQLPVADIYGQHWSLAENAGPVYDAPDEAVYLPGRNLLLVSKAAVYCALNEVDRIALGLLAGNPFPDATDEFFEALQRTLRLGLGRELRIERPLASRRKDEVVRLGAGLPLGLTFSCVRPVQEMHCGDCNKCAERQRGFQQAGLADPTAYARSRPL